MNNVTRRKAPEDKQLWVSSDHEVSLRPVPDPTQLTTEQLLRENKWLRELLESRLDAMDKAVDRVQQSILDKIPLEIDLRVEHLKELVAEKFSSIQTQFIERDTRTEQTQRDSRVAVDAALQAAKEAVGEQNKSSGLAIAKSEASTTKQIDGLQVLISNVSAALDGKITDVKERMTGFENRTLGAGSARTEIHDSKTFGLSIVVAMMAAVGMLLGIMAYFKHA